MSAKLSKAKGCLSCGHSKMHHDNDDDGCWAALTPTKLCRCQHFADVQVEEVDRYGVLDRDEVEAEARKQAGMTAAMGMAPKTWNERFVQQVEVFARSGRRFTSEDVVMQVGLPNDVDVNANNAVGALMNSLARQRLIKKTGLHVLAVRPESHGRELAEWVGTIDQ